MISWNWLWALRIIAVSSTESSLRSLQQLELGAAGRGRCSGYSLSLNPPEALDQHAHGVVGELEHLQHARGAADLVHLVGQGVLRLRVALQDHAQQAVAADHVVNELGALGGLDQQGRDHAREDDDVRQAQDGQQLRQGAGRDARGRFRAAGGPQDADKLGLGRGHGRAIQQFRCRRPEKGSRKRANSPRQQAPWYFSHAAARAAHQSAGIHSGKRLWPGSDRSPRAAPARSRTDHS